VTSWTLFFINKLPIASDRKFVDYTIPHLIGYLLTVTQEMLSEFP